MAARFAAPRRVYGQSHVQGVGEVMRRVKAAASSRRGCRSTYAPEVLGHFILGVRAGRRGMMRSIEA